MIKFNYKNLTIKFETIFDRIHKYISINSLLFFRSKYLVIEIVDNSKFLNIHHFPHAIQFNKFNFDEIKNTIDISVTIIINAQKPNCFLYYSELKKMGYKKIYILKWH